MKQKDLLEGQEKAGYFDEIDYEEGKYKKFQVFTYIYTKEEEYIVISLLI